MKEKREKELLVPADEGELMDAVRAAQRGEAEAFGIIYDILADRIYRFILLRTQHRETAEDITHTTFLKAWENIVAYEERPGAKFSTWLFQIAYYTLIDYYRRRRVEVEIGELSNAISIVPNNPSVIQEIRSMLDGFEELPADYRTVLQLRFIEGFSVGETAEILGRSAIATRVLQHRALARLRRVMEGHYL